MTDSGRRPRVSVVVNTLDRASSLGLTLHGLERLDYPAFEVVVVNGPSTDGTEAVLERWQGRIKVGRCAHRNLSESRNIGIALAAGDVVAFIDDDAYPDPAWLDRLVEAYEDPEVAASGGPVYNHTGHDIQCWVSFADRLGHVWDNKARDVDRSALLAFPLSREFVSLIGTNSSFRRDALLEVGGFDEDFVYFLDETELCCRLVDRGCVIRNLDDGFVYHKFLPNDIREDNRVFRDAYQIMKSRFLMALKHGARTHTVAEVAESIASAAATLRGHYEKHVPTGELTEADRAKFERDIPLAAEAAIECALRPTPATRPAAWFEARTTPFLPFEPVRPAGRRLHLCFFSAEYPPGAVNGIGRQIHALATGLAAAGHHVRVLTTSATHDRVDLEEGVWVHRLVPRPHAAPGDPALATLPAHVWDHSATLRDELARIHAHRPVDLVQVPNWDSEGLATVLDGRIPTVVFLHTPLRTVAAVDDRFGAALERGDPDLVSLVAAERAVYRGAGGVVACGRRIVADVERAYGVTFDPTRTGIVPHGLPDAATAADMAANRARRPGPVRVLFVGRLEPRKGIDTLLAAIPRALERAGDVVFTIAGDDSFDDGTGDTYRHRFEAAHPDLAAQVMFEGRVDDEVLRSLYADADVFVGPSRFESFGLTVIEAMMFATPVVVTTGFMVDLVEDGDGGVVVEPGDVDGLVEAIVRLAGSDEERAAMGRRARARYERSFTVGAMVRAAEAFYEAFVSQPAVATA